MATSHDLVITPHTIRALHQQLIIQGTPDFIPCIAFSPDGRLLALGMRDGGLELWDTQSYTRRLMVRAHETPVKVVTFAPDSRLMVSTADQIIKIWDVETGLETAVLRESCRSILFSPDGTLLAIGLWNGSVRLHSMTQEYERLMTFGRHQRDVIIVIFSPDGQQLFTASNRRVKLWEIATSRVIASFEGHHGLLYSVALSPNGQWLATASEDHTVKLYDVAARRELTTLTGHHGEVNRVAFSPNSQLLASGANDRTIKLWKPDDGHEYATFKGQSGLAIAFSPDSQLLASEAEDRTVRIWDIAQRRKIAVLKGHSAAVPFVAFDNTGTHFATGSFDGSVRLWGVG